MACELSIILPVFNEAKNIEILYKKITDVLKPLGINYEIIFIDDGSIDNSFLVIENIARTDRNVKIVQFTKNFGQTAALAAGFAHAEGEIILPMDADLQNDPADIPHFLAEIKKDYDLVSGWRKNRRDPFFTKLLPSLLANKVISLVTGIKLRDYGCTMKAYRKNVIKHLNLYGEMHRFIPVFAFLEGARITEIPIKHNPRIFGKSKYGISRVFKVILDLMVAKFLLSYGTRPIYLFGFLSFLCLFFGFLVGLRTLYIRYILHIPGLYLIPLVLLIMLLLQSALIFFLMGLLAEIAIRTYHEAQNKPIYRINKTIPERKEN